VPPPTMRAARFEGDRRVELEEVPVPEPGPGQVLVRVHSCALCGSDRPAWLHGSSTTPGHEVSGTVSTVGPDVTVPGPGRRGVVFFVDGCGRCASCRDGSPNRCLDRRAMYGFTVPGGFADYMVVRAECFLPVADEVPLDQATALLDLFGTTAHALRRAATPQARTVLVMGCGPIGLGAIAVARALGIDDVVGVDVSPFRLQLAQSVGARAIDAGTSDPIEMIQEGSPGFDLVIEAAGLPITQRRAFDLTAPGGVTVVVAHAGEPLEVLPSRDFIARERTLMGAEYFRPDEFAGNHERLRSGVLDPRPLLTHRFPLDRIGAACKAFFGGGTGKVLVQP
jgi:threonine 3-dehydrogenase